MSRIEPLTAAEVAELDPGIAETVLWLRANGFDTIDSGDGYTKFRAGDAGCAIARPNVAIVAAPDQLVMECRRLRALIESTGARVEPLGPEEGTDVEIQGSYDPGDDGALILLLGFTLPARAVA